jgi:epoxide hydrolase
MVQPCNPTEEDAFAARLALLARRLCDETDPHEGLWQSRGIAHGEFEMLLETWRLFDLADFSARLKTMPRRHVLIASQRLHFLQHEASAEQAPALLMLHGWPSSFLEMERTGRLISDALPINVIIPSLPGFAFSTPLGTPPTQQAIADQLASLMQMLGHERYFVHGHDWGASIAQALAAARPDNVRGVHLSFMPTPPPDGAEFVGEDGDRARQLRRHMAERKPYWQVQSNTPKTLGIGLDTSPQGLLAWIGERFFEWCDPTIGPAVDAILDTVTLYWATRSAGSSMFIYHANDGSRAQPTLSPKTPVGVAVLPYDIVRPIRSLAEDRFAIARWTELPGGGHFPGFEVPDLIAADLACFIEELP